MKYLFISIISLTLSAGALSQKLPLTEWSNSTSSISLFYICGDGGMNSFSTALCNSLNKAGYGVTALNSRSYFWDKKTPQQAASDISAQLEKILPTPQSRLVLIGYSFGADVLPFIINRLPPNIKSRVNSVILLAPSSSTDFEIHISDMFGQNNKYSMDVVTEINQLATGKTVIIQNSEEEAFPLKSIITKNLVIEKLSGSHHFDGDINLLTQTVLKYCK